MTNNESEHEGKVTEDYPGFVVDDGRVSGSITMGHSRLPLWCVIQIIVKAGYRAALRSHPDIVNRATADEIGWFLYDLLENRKEFGRLLCVLADVERRERETRDNEYGCNAAFLYGGNSQVREEVEPALANIGVGQVVEVDHRNLPPALKPWYASPENVTRVREALVSCLDHLHRLAMSWSEPEEADGQPVDGSEFDGEPDDTDFDARIKADLEAGRLDDAMRRALEDESKTPYAPPVNTRGAVRD
jgi:hypothetical protein